MRPLSLAIKLNILIAATFATIFAFNIATLANRVHAGFQMEMKSNLKLAQELAKMEIVNGRDPMTLLRQVFGDPEYRRRVDLRVIWSGSASRPPIETLTLLDKNLETPQWFSALISPQPQALHIPVTVHGMMKFGVIELTFYPDLEAGKAWSTLTRLSLNNLLALGLIFATVFLFMNRWLYPFKALGAGLSQLERGMTNFQLKLEGAVEFVEIASKLNSLAVALDRAESENRTLLERLVKTQDEERANIARDLHDEVAPCLFSIRTGVLALSRSSVANESSARRLRELCDQIGTAGNALQDVIGRMLDELRPPGLHELGLEPALRGLLASRQALRPDVSIALETPHDLHVIDEAVALTAYRVVQEALTNIYRHSSARCANVALAFEHLVSPGSDGEPRLGLRVTVSDNGVGIGSDRKKGRGLVGMSERVRALNGQIKIYACASGGTIVDAILPLERFAEPANP
ncbi:MAG: histidine kinase [Methylocystis silviterrae]